MRTFSNANPASNVQLELDQYRRELESVLTPKKLKQALRNFPDYSPADLQNRQGYVSKVLGRAIPNRKPGQKIFPSVPRTLSQFEAAQTRLAIGTASVSLIEPYCAGRPAFYVTVADPEWLRDRHMLAGELFVEVRNWATRRCRRLRKHFDYRAIGVVDVAWCDRAGLGLPSNWSVHIHIMIVLMDDVGSDAKALIDAAFTPTSPKCNDGAAIKVKSIKGFAGFARAREYTSLKVMAQCCQHRMSRRDQDGKLTTHDRDLSIARALELYSALRDVGPRQRVILSGYRWRAGGVIALLTDAQTGAAQKVG